MSFTPGLKAKHATPGESGYPRAPRTFVNLANIVDGAIPVTQLQRAAGEDISLETNGSIVFFLDLPSETLRAGDLIRIDGVTTDGYTGLNGQVLQVVSATGTSPTEVILRSAAIFPEIRVNLNAETTTTLQIPYSYVEFYGCKAAAGTANTGETLVGPAAAVCFQPLGKGATPSSMNNIGYQSTPINGDRLGLQHWHFQVAADGDGVLCVIWP